MIYGVIFLIYVLLFDISCVIYGVFPLYLIPPGVSSGSPLLTLVGSTSRQLLENKIEVIATV